MNEVIDRHGRAARTMCLMRRTVLMSLMVPLACAALTVPATAAPEPAHRFVPLTTVDARGATDIDWPAYYPRAATAAAPEAAPAPDEPAEVLLRRFFDLHSAMRYEEALVAVRALAARAPGPLAEYNLACVLGRLYRTDEAQTAFDRAVDVGWRNGTHARLDPDLALLHDRPAFAQTLARMETLAVRERIVPGPLRRDAWPAVAGDLERDVPGLLARYGVPGATVALVHDGRMVWAQGFGIADAATGAPMEASTRFRLASPRHLLALVAVAQLGDRNALDLRDLVRAAGDDAPVYETLRLAVEVASGEPFGRYCRGEVLEPRGIRETAVRAGTYARENAGGAGFSRDLFDVPEARLAVGHTPLGTPLGPWAGVSTAPGDEWVETTGPDLAVLIASLLPDSQPSGVSARTIRAARALGPRGFAVRASGSAGGMRLELAARELGGGCLVRWHPNARAGVVVLFNGGDGGAAAARIAHLALGGDPGSPRTPGFRGPGRHR